MLVIEIRDQWQRPLAQVAVIPMPSAAAFPREQYDDFQDLARRSGHRYFFLVTADTTFGWRTGDDPQHPSLKFDTTALLSRYADNPASVTTNGETYLAELFHAWLADLATGWKGPGPVPAEADMAQLGLLAELRDGARAEYAPL